MSAQWSYITEELLASPLSVSTLVESLKTTPESIDDVFYELILSIAEYDRASTATYSSILAALFKEFPNNEEKFLVLSQAFPSTSSLNSFLKNCSIDKSLKVLHLDKNILKSEGIFPDYGRYQYIDARTRIFSVDSYSSLHESSEGFAKYISEIISFMDKPENPSDLVDTLDQITVIYELDANRCTLIMLNIFANFLGDKEDVVLDICRNCSWWRTQDSNSSIQSTINSYLLNVREENILELRMITLLIKHEILDFKQVYNCLGPLNVKIIDSATTEANESNEMNELLDTTLEQKQKDAAVSNVSALAMASLLPDSDDEEDNKGEKEDKVATSETLAQETILDKSKYFNKVQLLDSFIHYKMFEYIDVVLGEFPEIPLIYDRIADRLNDLVESFITPFYFEFVDNLNLLSADVEVEVTIQINNLDEMFDAVIPYVNLLKYKIMRNSSLVTKLVRILKTAILKNIEENEICFEFFRNYIFLYLPFSHNIPLVNESFSILSCYPLETRYNLYGEYSVMVKKDPATKLNNDICEKKTKDLLKRLSVENINTSCRSLNKLISVNPIAASNTFISHIESYSSLIELVCESSKFFNDFAWDVITYQLLTKLYGNRSPMQPDGINYTQWFGNLTQFIGKLGSLYPESFQLSPILLSVVKSLINKNFCVLEILQALINSMTGIKPINNLSYQQIMRLNAEKSLKQLAYFSIQDNREITRRSCSKLLRIMIDDGVFSKIFILLSQVQFHLLNEVDNKPLKIINQRLDDVNLLLHSFITTFESNLGNKTFKENMTSISNLIKKYSVKPEWCFEVWRPYIAEDLRNSDNDSNVIVSELRESIKDVLPYQWEHMNIGLYIMFWMLSLYDINYQDLSYMMEYSNLKTQITGINLKLRRRNDLPMKDVVELEEKHRYLTRVSAYIKEDMLTHETNNSLVMKKIEKEKDQWFETADDSGIKKTMLAFMQYCLLPRLQHSSFDAVFVSKFIFMLNSLDVQNYSLAQILENFFVKDILKDLLYTNTSLQTENLASFYQLVIKKLKEWWSDPEKYANEGHSFKSTQTYEEYRLLLKSWFDSLLNQVIKSLDVDDYTTRNNTILFLKVILTQFPVIEEHADKLLDRVNQIAETDDREDIKLASRALVGLVTFNKSKLLPVWEFYSMPSDEKEKAMKAKAEKMKAQRERDEEERKRKLEEDRKERERLMAESGKPTSKPYGLVQLKTEKKEQRTQDVRPQRSGNNPLPENSKDRESDKTTGPTIRETSPVRDSNKEVVKSSSGQLEDNHGPTKNQNMVEDSSKPPNTGVNMASITTLDYASIPGGPKPVSDASSAKVGPLSLESKTAVDKTTVDKTALLPVKEQLNTTTSASGQVSTPLQQKLLVKTTKEVSDRSSSGNSNSRTKSASMTPHSRISNTKMDASNQNESRSADKARATSNAPRERDQRNGANQRSYDGQMGYRNSRESRKDYSSYRDSGHPEGSNRDAYRKDGTGRNSRDDRVARDSRESQRKTPSQKSQYRDERDERGRGRGAWDRYDEGRSSRYYDSYDYQRDRRDSRDTRDYRTSRDARSSRAPLPPPSAPPPPQSASTPPGGSNKRSSYDSQSGREKRRKF